MSDDLIKRDDALAAIYEDSPEWTREALAKLPAIDPAAIREAALREAAARIGGMIRGSDETEYEEGYNDALATAERHILSLIEKGAADGLV